MSIMAPEETTNDQVNISDLESMWDEPPPKCEFMRNRVPCGKIATWILDCVCPRCSHIGRAFICRECHDMIVSPGSLISCNKCAYPMALEWKPI